MKSAYCEVGTLKSQIYVRFNISSIYAAAIPLLNNPPL